MTRAALIAALMTALLAGPSFAAGAPSSGDEEAEDPAADEMMQPHPVTLPGSYVALPDDVVTKIRNKILISRGEEPEDHDAKASGGGH